MSELVISSLSISRSELPVVTGIDARVESGSISVVLGANGAGKTTLLEGLSGIIPVASGTIAIDGHEIQKARPGQRSRQGLAHVEQGRTIFSQLTTEENMKVALRDGSDLSEAYGLFPELLQRRTVRAGLLSGGEQQMLVIARALLTQPKVLMIDEMSAGLAPVIVSRLMAAVRKLADAGLAVLLVEQFAALALGIGNRAYVLRRGRVVYDGDCKTLLRSPGELHKLYLGGG
jgi:branched-chain amino acid transport system ATP-binding protein